MQANEKAAKELVAEKRRAHELRLQLHENQTLFAEVMAEAREIILASVGGDEEPLTETESEEPPAAAAGEERRRSAPWGDAAAGAREGGGGAAALQGGQVRFGAGGGRAGAYASSVDESDLEAPPAPMVTAAPPLPVKQMQEARYSNGHGARSGSSSGSGNGAAAHSQNGARRTTELSGDSAAAAGAATAAAGAASAALLQEAAGAMLPPGPPADHSGASGSSDEGSLDVSSLDVEQLATDAEDLLTVRFACLSTFVCILRCRERSALRQAHTGNHNAARRFNLSRRHALPRATRCAGARAARGGHVRFRMAHVPGADARGDVVMARSPQPRAAHRRSEPAARRDA